MPLHAIALPGAELALDPHWLPAAEADALFTTLLATLPWEVHRIRLFGRELASPRLSCWIGDPGAVYAYSGARFVPQPWPAPLRLLRTRLAAELGVAFNSVLANLYRDGRDRMGWHADDEPELGPAPVIASVSLGAARRFVLKSRRTPVLRRELVLSHGSLLVMAGTTQREWKHALPATSRPVGARVNLTFRWVREAG